MFICLLSSINVTILDFSSVRMSNAKVSAMVGIKVRGVTVMRSVGGLVVKLRHRLSHSPPRPLTTVGLMTFMYSGWNMLDELVLLLYCHLLTSVKPMEV